MVFEGERHAADAFAMPGPEGRSGFWATVPVTARDQPRPLELQLSARLEGGAAATAPLGSIDVVEREPPPALEAEPADPDADLIALCMATFEPDMELFRAQVESLREQTDRGWVCLISDDSSSPERLAEMTGLIGDDRRFHLSPSPERLGFYRNFERALRLVPAEARLVALCDQDDRWHGDKLEVLRGALADATLVYSDQRLVDADGRVLRETLWEGRSNNHTNLASMLVANTVTGAATLFRRELLEPLLPFPDTPGFQFHDHWLGLVALASGDIAYVDRPLYDYVQHAGAVFCDVTHGSRPRGGPGLIESWRAGYFYGYLARQVAAEALLVRCGQALTPDKRRALERFVAAERSPAAFAWLAARPLRRLLGRTETLGTEIELAEGLLWRRLAARRGNNRFPGPASFNQKRLRRWRARI